MAEESGDADGGSDGGDERRAVESFERLGLTSYEARVFIALQRLGSGTARDVSRVTDVPRSQVYSAAESLADRGLASVQQSSPMRYRPVSVDAARSTLRERFDRETDRAFDYVERVRGDESEEQREDIWTVRGREVVTDRVVELLDDAEDRVLFGTRLPALAPPAVVEALDRVAADSDVTIVSVSETVRGRFSSPVETATPPTALAGEDRSGRFLFVDDDVVLLSVVGDEDAETAIWSAHSSMASVLIQLAEISLGVD